MDAERVVVRLPTPTRKAIPALLADREDRSVFMREAADLQIAIRSIDVYPELLGYLTAKRLRARGVIRAILRAVRLTQNFHHLGDSACQRAAPGMTRPSAKKFHIPADGVALCVGEARAGPIGAKATIGSVVRSIAATCIPRAYRLPDVLSCTANACIRQLPPSQCRSTGPPASMG